MPFRIQRVPQGLNQLLSVFGGQTPVELEDRVRGTLELIQFYGNQQRQPITAVNAALAELTALSVATPSTWFVLFAANFSITKTATMTALRASINIGIGNGTTPVVAEELGPFGATETGQARVAWVAPYPMILPPGTTLFGLVDILGTDVNCNAALLFDIGRLG